jgi:tetratricopeptide (TPR) repeat protein
MEELQAASRATGMPIHGLVDMKHWDVRLSAPDQATRDAGRAILEQAIRDAHAMGGHSVLLVPGKVGDDASHEEVWSRSIPEIQQVLPVAASLGVRVLIENVWNGFCETPEEARDYLDEIGSPWVGAYFDIGNAHVQLAQSAAALVAFEKAATLRRDFWEAINNQGLVLFDQGKTKAAIARWRQVLKLKPDAAEPTLALAPGLFSQGLTNRQEALELANKALTSDPNYVLDSYQKDQLWGPKLRQATQELLLQNELKSAVERAKANANPDGDNGDDG